MLGGRGAREAGRGAPRESTRRAATFPRPRLALCARARAPRPHASLPPRPPPSSESVFKFSPTHPVLGMCSRSLFAAGFGGHVLVRRSRGPRVEGDGGVPSAARDRAPSLQSVELRRPSTHPHTTLETLLRTPPPFSRLHYLNTKSASHRSNHQELFQNTPTHQTQVGKRNRPAPRPLESQARARRVHRLVQHLRYPSDARASVTGERPGRF